MRRETATALLVLIAVLGGAAMGHEQTRFDGDDSDGPLDIAAARQEHRRLHEASSHSDRTRVVTELRFRVTTYEKWSRSLLEGKRNFIAIEFDLDSDKRIERCLVITNGVHELVGRLYRHCYGKRGLIAATSVGRPDRHSVKAVVDKRRLKRGLSRYRWRTISSFEASTDDEDDPCRGGAAVDRPYGSCIDRTKWRRHRF